MTAVKAVKAKKVVKPQDEPRKSVSRKGVGGHPTILTPELQADIVASRTLGLSWSRCARLAGTNHVSVKNWRDQGEAALAIPSGKRTAMDQKCVEFFKSLERVEDEWTRRCEMILTLTMLPGQNETTWRKASIEDRREAASTAKWKLSNQAPEEYSTKTRAELSGKDGESIDVELSAEKAWEILNAIQSGKPFEVPDDHNADKSPPEAHWRPF